MANLTENTQYNTTSNAQSPLAKLPSITKLLQQNTQKTVTNNLKSTLDTHFNPDLYSSLFSGGKVNPTVAENSYIPPTGQPVVPQQEGAYQPLPEGYTQFKGSNPGDPWSTPSDQAKLRNWPSDLGGGQFVIDPTQPSALIKSTRAIMDDNLSPGIKQSILGDLPSNMFQVDHIVPLWAGGADTLGNLQIYGNLTHAKKTAAQAVPLTLLANGKISLNEAKIMISSWQDKNIEGLPDPDEKGYLPLDVAEKYATKWKNPGSPDSFMKTFGEQMGKWGQGIIPDIIREPIKGFIGGFTAGIVPGTGTSPESGTAGSVANLVGNIAGTILGLGKLAKLASWGIKGSKALRGANKAISITEDAMKAAGAMTDVGKQITPIYGVAKKMRDSAILLTTWGQLGLAGRELTGQEEFDLQTHVKQATNDIMFGAMLGSAGIYGKGGQTIKGYSHVGLGTTALALMQQDTPNIQEALKEGILMTALHGMGYKNGRIDPNKRLASDEAYKMSVRTMNDWVGDLVPSVKKGQTVPTVLELDLSIAESKRIEYQTKYPNDQRFKGLEQVSTQEQAVDLTKRIAEKEMGNWIDKTIPTIDGKRVVSPELIAKIKAERTRIVTSANQMFNQTLSPELRVEKEWKDLVTMGKNLQPSVTSADLRPARDTSELLTRVSKTTPETLNKTFENTTGEKFLEDISPITGQEMNANARATIIDMKANPGNYASKWIVIKDPEASVIMRFVNSELASKGKTPAILDPNQTLQVYALKNVRDASGNIVGYEPKYIGNVPEKRSFNDKQFALNEPAIKAEIDPVEGKAPMIKFDAETVNTNNVSNEMDKKGIQSLFVDPVPEKIYGTSGRKPYTYGQFKYNEQDWLRSMAKKEGILPVTELKQTVTPTEPTPIVPPQAPTRTPETLIPKKGVITTPISKAPIQPEIKWKGSLIQDLVDKSKITAKEAEPYLEKEAKVSFLNEEASSRYLTSGEKRDILEMGRSIKDFLEKKNLIKPVNEVKWRPSDPGIKVKRINDLLKNALIHAESEMDFVKSTTAEKGSKAYTNALEDAASKSFSLIQGEKGLSSVEKREIRKNLSTEIKNMIQKKVDAAYEGTVSLPNEKFPQGQRYEDIPKSEFIEREKQLFADGRFAEKWNLKLDDKGFVAQDKNGDPVFTDAFKEKAGIESNMTVREWFNTKGNPAKRSFNEDLRIFDLSKTTNSRSFIEGLDKASENPDLGPVFKTFKMGIDLIVNNATDPVKPTNIKSKLNDLKTLGKDARSSWKLNALVGPNSEYMKDLNNTVNAQGHSISQPKKRFTDYKDNKLRQIDEQTKALEEASKAAKTERDLTINPDAPLTDLPRGVDKEFLRNSSVQDIHQLEKIQDLTKFESMISSMHYKDITGENAPIEMKVDDGIKLISDFVSYYNASIKSTGKTKAAYLDKKAKDAIRNYMLKLFNETKTDGAGGPYDGQGGLLGNMWGGVKDVFSNKTAYAAPKEQTYNVRGLNFNDKDLDEASKIIGLEISNRPGKDEFETHNIINTAINRALTNPKQWGSTITEVLQKPAQYQAYAPEGMKNKKGVVIPSRYQQLQQGSLSPGEIEKVKRIRGYLDNLKTESYKDTTEGATYYVHASDGTLWIGKTQKEALNAASNHENVSKIQKTRFGEISGMPVEAKG